MHLVSGPVGSPVVDQQFEYNANGLGLLTDVYNVHGSQEWDYHYNYDARNRLVGYTTTGLPEADSYEWTYDEVGNRIQEVYNGATTDYIYSNNSDNRLTSLSGGATDSWSYNLDGSVKIHGRSDKNILYKYPGNVIRK